MIKFELGDGVLEVFDAPGFGGDVFQHLQQGEGEFLQLRDPVGFFILAVRGLESQLGGHGVELQAELVQLGLHALELFRGLPCGRLGEECLRFLLGHEDLARGEDQMMPVLFNL